MGCPLCGGFQYPHAHDLGTIWNAKHYCPDGEPHEFIKARAWIRTWNFCVRCEYQTRREVDGEGE